MSEISPTMQRELPFQFTGQGFEYFKIWIVNICLTILTVGIYSAWAKVRTQRYFYGNTHVDNNTFSYLADPVTILKGRIIAVGFLAIYSMSWQFFPDFAMLLLGLLLLLVPFILVTGMSFKLRNSAYRNLRFYFERNYKGAYLVFLWPLLTAFLLTWIAWNLFQASDVLVQMQNAPQQEGQEFSKYDLIPTFLMLSLLPVIPYLDYLRVRFLVDHSQFGTTEATFHTGAWSFYKLYLIAFLMFVVAAMVVGGMIGVIGATFKGEEGPGNTAEIMAVTTIGLVVLYTVMFFISAYLRAKRTNLIYNNIALGESRLRSELKTMPVGWIYLSNTIAIICSLGLLVAWAKVRMARYVANCTSLIAANLDDIVAKHQSHQSALGEELGDAFDLDIGL